MMHGSIGDTRHATCYANGNIPFVQPLEEFGCWKEVIVIDRVALFHEHSAEQHSGSIGWMQAVTLPTHRMTK